MPAPSSTRKLSDTVWEIPTSYKEGMRVPARVYATAKLLGEMDAGVFEQVSNVATLPGIVGYALCMPDGHWGYGFPIGGVAAIDPRGGVISPGGIGFDINCGMRLVLTRLTHAEIADKLRALVDALYRRVPAGVGSSGFIKLDRDGFREVAEKGARWCLERGLATPADLEATEDGGCFGGADASKVSERALARGLDQVGTLGSGNHYLEIQVAKREHVHDSQLARALGIDRDDQVVVMFHCGSRGFGHQVASDYVEVFLKSMKKHGLPLRDRELACAPFDSPEGQDYFAAMKCAANMAFANRQVILHRVREVFSDVLGRDARELGLEMVYDVAHNTAKLEEHVVEGRRRRLLVHRKGSTRAFGPGHPELAPRFQKTGQPVIIGGSMETGSYLLVGTPSGAETFFSSAHGSGRSMSRAKARKQFDAKTLLKQLDARGIYVRAVSNKGLVEEAGPAYKDVDEVIDATQAAGLSRKVVRFVPIGNVKG